jgi:hypothetical protein
MIYICKNDKLNRFLEKYIKKFILSKDDFKLIGIDFEFNRIENKRQIALCQILFYTSNKEDIFLFYPPDINKDLLEELFISDIIKVIHGGESLDIPYLFENIIQKENRRQFCLTLYDTRYMCEYEKGVSCKIYELLLNKKVISKKTYNKLMENDKLMGNIWDINIDVKNLSKELALYSMYDVKFLAKLYFKFQKNNNDDVYNKYIPEIACVVLNLRYENLLDPLFTNISKHNLDRINNRTFIDYYKESVEEILSDTILKNIYSINYFKKFMEILFKNILYHKLNNNIKLYDFNIDNNFIKKIINKINLKVY